MSVPDGHGGRVTHGPRINLITDVTDRDPIAGTPHHKDVSVRLEAATDEEEAVAQRESDRVHQLATQRGPNVHRFRR
jgi:predicted molibdopterin-dependent oxidoreductase YjgC